jgi:hypothetical protein
MPTYRIDEQGAFAAFEETKAEELEFELEEWLERNDHVLLSPERLLYVGRQVTTDLNKAIDLLAVDSSGKGVVIELKKDRTPRDMAAQALEYAAFVRKLDYDGLNGIATTYFKRKGLEWENLSDAHRGTFVELAEDQEPAWNSRQTVILVGQTIQPDLVEVGRYLRDHNIDIRILQFVHFMSSSGERIVNVETVIGKEQLPSDASRTASGSLPTLDQLLARTPEVQGIYGELQRQFARIGLIERRERTTIAFDLRPGEPVINMWPSPAGRVIVLVLGRRVNLDPLRAAASNLGLFVKEGKAVLSFHIYPKNREQIGPFTAQISAQLLDKRDTHDRPRSNE